MFQVSEMRLPFEPAEEFMKMREEIAQAERNSQLFQR